MIGYELSQLLHFAIPYMGGALCVVIGIIIANIFWKARIHRYAKTEIVETLEYQKNKIESLENEIIQKDETISEYVGIIKVVNIAALKIVGASK